jgi:CheY-like chemotaxis protein
VPQPVRAAQPRRHLRVLLAEDNPVNQTLATILLEKEGHQVVLAATGKEALAALERQPFDLVLMDVSMPEMDGLEATQAIRQQEQGSGRHLPIIALTAHAMKGDRERCLAAGADGYVSKPLQPYELYQTIDAAVPPAPGGPLPPSPPPPAVERVQESPSAPPVFDRAEAMRRVGGDETILQEVAAMFLDECPRWQIAIQQAIREGDSKALQRAAHTLKGAVGIFSCRAAFEAAQNLETLGRKGDLSTAAEAYQVLQEALTRLEPALQELLPHVAGRSG